MYGLLILGENAILRLSFALSKLFVNILRGDCIESGLLFNLKGFDFLVGVDWRMLSAKDVLFSIDLLS